jgi:hypothetical protein
MLYHDVERHATFQPEHWLTREQRVDFFLEVVLHVVNRFKALL